MCRSERAIPSASVVTATRARRARPFFMRQAMRLRLVVVPVALSSVLLASGCTGLIAAGSGLGAVGGALATANQVSAAVDPVIATACQDYAKGKSAADALVAAGLVSAATAAKVKSIEAFGDAACANPPAGNALSTAIWLGQLVGEIAALTSPAKPAG
jgi:hypothetical protein